MTTPNKIALFDFDGTLTRTDTIKFLLISLVLSRPSKAMQVFPLFTAWLTKELDVQLFKTRAIGILIDGLSPDALKKNLGLFGWLVGRYKNLPVIEHMHALKQAGHHILIVTASPDFAIASLDWLKGCEVVGTQYAMRDKHFTAKLKEKVCIGPHKATTLLAWKNAHPGAVFTTAVSDSTIDEPMLKLAEEAFYVDAKGRFQPYTSTLTRS